MNGSVTHSNGNGHDGPKMTEIPQKILESSLLQEPLSEDDISALGACFDKNTVFADALVAEVQERLLPKVAARMGWSEGATCRKLRANTSASVSIRYNSDYHRDRHLFGTSPQGSMERKIAAWSNISAVIYLDPAAFGYVKDSAWLNPQGERHLVKQEFPGGTMIFFPSSLVHRAFESSIPSARRTIIAFDIEDASISQPSANATANTTTTNTNNTITSSATNTTTNTRVPHIIIRMPWIFQWAAFHLILTVDQVQSVVFYYLFTDSLYGWRFLPKWCRTTRLCRVHWQVTTPKEQESHYKNSNTDNLVDPQQQQKQQGQKQQRSQQQQQQQQQHKHQPHNQSPPPESKKIGEVLLNSSIYMPQKSQGSNEHIHFYDYPFFVGYVLRLIDAYTFKFGYTR